SGEIAQRLLLIAAEEFLQHRCVSRDRNIATGGGKANGTVHLRGASTRAAWAGLRREIHRINFAAQELALFHLCLGRQQRRGQGFKGCSQRLGARGTNKRNRRWRTEVRQGRVLRGL